MTRKIWAVFVIFGIYLGYFGITQTQAQTGGQFCVRSYEDRNGNGLFDPQDEPLLTRGISIELLNSNSIVLASALLDKSPNADAGVVCFQNLSDGDYSVMISSADYAATTPRLVSKTVSSTALPTVIEFGAQRIGSGEAVVPVAQAQTTSAPSFSEMTPEQMQAFVLRLAFSAVGGVLMMLFMLFIGFFIYMLRMRNTQPRPIVYSNASVAPMDDFGGFEAVNANEPPITLEDTNPVTPPNMD